MAEENGIKEKDGCKPSAPVDCCKNCGRSLKWLMLLAMLEDAGAKCYPNALYCSPGNEHVF